MSLRKIKQIEQNNPKIFVFCLGFKKMLRKAISSRNCITFYYFGIHGGHKLISDQTIDGSLGFFLIKELEL